MPPAPAENCSDREPNLVARIRAGDESALGAVFRAYYPRLCGVVHAYVRSRAISEEIVQELFLRLWRQRERLEIAESLRAYLLRAARNSALSHLKRRRLEDDWQERAVAGPPRLMPSADEPMAEEALAQAVERAIAALPERCRLVYTLKRVQGLSHGEIAAALNISPKTVEVQMTRALHRLREALSDYFPS